MATLCSFKFLKKAPIFCNENSQPFLRISKLAMQTNNYGEAFRKVASRGIVIIRKYSVYKEYPHDYFAITFCVPKKELKKVMDAMRKVPTNMKNMPVEYKYLKWWQCRFKQFKIVDYR